MFFQGNVEERGGVLMDDEITILCHDCGKETHWEDDGICPNCREMCLNCNEPMDSCECEDPKSSRDGKMRCNIEGCGLVDESNSAYCSKHGRSPHKIKEVAS